MGNGPTAAMSGESSDKGPSLGRGGDDDGDDGDTDGDDDGEDEAAAAGDDEAGADFGAAAASADIESVASSVGSVDIELAEEL